MSDLHHPSVDEVKAGPRVPLPDDVVAFREALDAQLVGHGVELVVGEGGQEGHTLQHPDTHVPVQEVAQRAEEGDEIVSYLA